MMDMIRAIAPDRQIDMMAGVIVRGTLTAMTMLPMAITVIMSVSMNTSIISDRGLKEDTGTDITEITGMADIQTDDITCLEIS
jgi:hypothetical protein